MASSPKKPIVRIIEAARGFAALHVFLFHINDTDFFNLTHRFPTWAPLLNIFCGYGHQAVIFFFLLSGFSISYSTHGRDLSDRHSIGLYAYQRLRRIYPIVLVTLVLCTSLLLLGNALASEYFAKTLAKIDAVRVFAALMFLGDIWKGLWFSTFPTDPPLWSLSYEVIYYLAFPLLWKAAQRFGWERVLLASVAISFLAAAPALVFGVHSFPCNMVALYWPWVAGAYIGHIKASGQRPFVLSSKIYFVVASWFVFLVLFVYRAVPVGLGELPFISDWLYGAVFGITMFYFLFPEARFYDLKDRFLTVLGISLGLAAIAVLAKITLSDGVLSLIVWASATGMFFSFLSLINAPQGLTMIIRLFLAPFERLGGISYALYLVHYPILFFFFSLCKSEGIPLIYALAMACPLVFGFAWLLEKPFQKWASAFLDTWIKPFFVKA